MHAAKGPSSITDSLLIIISYSPSFLGATICHLNPHVHAPKLSLRTGLCVFMVW